MAGRGSYGVSAEYKRARARMDRSLPWVVERVIKAAEGAPVICPNCGADTGERACNIEAAKLIIEQIMGKPAQRVEVDVTHKIELSADQVRALVDRAQSERGVFLLGPGHDGVQAEVLKGVVNADDNDS